MDSMIYEQMTHHIFYFEVKFAHVKQQKLVK